MAGTRRSPSRAPSRADVRRLRYVQRHPGSATSGDVARLLRAHGRPEDEVRFTVDRLRALAVSPFTAWMWVQRFDAATLAVVAGADLGQAELLGHLGEGVLPDLAGLQVLAELNGLPAADRPTPRPARRTLPARRPVVHEPGSWPYGGWVPTPGSPGHN